VAALDSIIDRSGLVYREQQVNLTIPMVNGEESFSNIRAIIAVYETMSDGRFRRLRMTDPWKRSHQQGTSGVTGPATEFFITEDPINNDPIIRLWPRPLSGNYVMFYLPASVILDNVADTVVYQQGWEEYIVLHMAIQALIKEESDPRALQQQQSILEARIREDCWSRVLGHKPTIRNVDSVERGFPGYMEGDWPPVSNWWFA
jgi:hypothetical protein